MVGYADNRAYVEVRTKDIRLTEEQRKDYLAQGTKYKTLRLQVAKEIEQHRKEISELEVKLENSMPSVPRSKCFHHTCGVRAVFHIGHDVDGGEPVYYCTVCDLDFQ